MDSTGPLLDMGPLPDLACRATRAGCPGRGLHRRAHSRARPEIGPRAGEQFAVETPSHATAAIELEAA